MSSEISSGSGSAEYSAPSPTDSPSAQRTNTSAESSQTVDSGELDYSQAPDYTTHNPTDNGELDYSQAPDYTTHNPTNNGELTDRRASDQTPAPVSPGDVSTAANGSVPRPDAPEARAEGARDEVARAVQIGEARDEVARAVQIGEARDEVARAVQIGEARAAVAEAYSTEGPAVREVVLDAPDGDPRTPDAPSAPADSTASSADDAGAQHGVSALEARQAQGDQLGGSPIQRAELWQPQGHNDRDYQGTCALSSVSAVLNDCGVKSTENDVVLRADATGRCLSDRADPTENGGVQRSEDLVSLLREQGVDARVEHPEGVEELAAWVEQGHGVIAEVSSATLWDGTGHPGTSPSLTSDFGLAADHAVVVTGTIRDHAGNLTDLVVNDTGRADGAAVQVPYRVFADAWNTDRDHEIVATTLPTSTERMGR